MDRTAMPSSVAIRRLFQDPDASLRAHHDAQASSHTEYCAVLFLLLHQGADIPKASRARILAAAWARRDYELADALLARDEAFSLPQVLAALAMLDAPRRARQLRAKLATARASRASKLREQINELEREDDVGSLSGALAKRVRAWVRTIPAATLSAWALSMPREPWVQLADMVHLNPNTDFAAAESDAADAGGGRAAGRGGGRGRVRARPEPAGTFLDVMFGKPPREGTAMHACQSISAENVAEVCARYDLPYSFVRTKVPSLPPDVRCRIASYMPVDQLIWYHEELACPEVDAVLLKRLRAGEHPRQMPYGKIMERLLYLRSRHREIADELLPIAEERLREIHVALEPPVLCAGDASGSMEVAIRCATVIGSVLSCVTSADLQFFNDKVFAPPVVPRTVAQVLQVTETVNADCSTAPAAVLLPLLQKKKPVKFLIVVTDEGENQVVNGEYFAPMFLKYRNQVSPDCTAVFVSFLDNPSFKGQMVTALEKLGVVPLQFRLDGRRPDLTKLDALLGLLASESSHFPRMVQLLCECASGKPSHVRAILERLKSPLVFDAPEAAPAAAAAAPTGGKKKNKRNKKKGGQQEAPEMQQQQQSSGLCVVCMDKAADTVFLECTHMCTCGACAALMKDCPVCRQKIARAVRVMKP
eukprot:m51a1_g4617 hypothetical protein (649) ;mRNA; r:283218-285345